MLKLPLRKSPVSTTLGLEHLEPQNNRYSRDGNAARQWICVHQRFSFIAGKCICIDDIVEILIIFIFQLIIIFINHYLITDLFQYVKYKALTIRTNSQRYHRIMLPQVSRSPYVSGLSTARVILTEIDDSYALSVDGEPSSSCICLRIDLIMRCIMYNRIIILISLRLNNERRILKDENERSQRTKDFKRFRIIYMFRTMN